MTRKEDVTGSAGDVLVLDRTERFGSHFEHTAVGEAMISADGVIRAVTERFCEMIEYTDEEPVGRHLSTVVHPDDLAQSLRQVQALLDEMVPYLHLELRFVRKDGSILHTVTSMSPGRDDSGRVASLAMVVQDVSELKRTEGDLRLLQAVTLAVSEAPDLDSALEVVLRMVCESAGWSCGAAWVPNDDGNRLVASRAWYGARPELEAFRRSNESVSFDPGEGMPGTVWLTQQATWVPDIADDPRCTRREEIRTAGFGAGLYVPVWSAHRLLALLEFFVDEPRDGDRRMLEVVANAAAQLANVLRRKQAEARLKREALHDTLTGLPNRVLFLELLSRALVREGDEPSEVAVAFIDLDRFKLVNHMIGHMAGDALLAILARRLEACIDSDDTVARFGSDEFVLLLENTDSAEIEALATRLRATISIPIATRGGSLVLTAGIGVASAGAGRPQPEDLVRDAEAALHRAKESGGGRCVVFDEGMRAEMLARLETDQSLRGALERDELFVLYQPVRLIETGRAVGVEALVRWRHPTRGVVSPDQFVPVAEATGLIVPIGELVLRAACHQGAEWARSMDESTRFYMSVNLSVVQIEQPEFVETVARILRESGLAPHRLCFEVTESALMRDPAETASVLGRLKQLGVGLVIDDFGTGYSSLLYLRGFPVDALKVDRSFVAGMATAPADRAIVQAVISLAHALDITAVAEGVEDEAQLVELKRMGCDYGQGFYWSEPRPADEVWNQLDLAR